MDGHSIKSCHKYVALPLCATDGLLSTSILSKYFVYKSVKQLFTMGKALTPGSENSAIGFQLSHSRTVQH
jgi:hypothetical protein